MKPINAIVLCGITALVLAGCGQEDKKQSTQTAARVNGEEITVHQVNFAATKLGKVPADQVQAASSQVLASLIDKELLRQKAVEDKLDRKPEVVQAMDASRRDILAQAYLDGKFQALSAPTEVEINDYYQAHPELFSERRIYRLREISINAGERLAQVKQQIQSSKSIDALIDWLKQEKIAAKGTENVKTAEQLPIGLLPRLAKLGAGQSLMLEGNGNLSLIIVVATQSQPIKIEQAKPAIGQFLANNKRQDLVKSEVEALRKAAKLEFKGDFNDARQAAAKPVAAEPAAAASSVAATPSAQTDDTLTKGIAGLK